mmetsp:Transcript_10651/g.31750  ORF Transcript_10651/g.31750 Transcript_10651/m.31750 type:complete len:227 (-) Transcript_10651:60-740(-)
MMRIVLALAIALRVAAEQELNRCGACFVVMESLKEVLRLEHLDEDKTDILSGGRLDSKGNRQGTTIKYATSEFRTSHLLDQVCEVASTFRPGKGQRWAQNATLAKRFETNLAGKTKIPLPKISRATTPKERLRVSLRTYCDALVEEHEEALAALIIGEGVLDEVGAVSLAGRGRVCGDLQKSCAVDDLLPAAEARFLGPPEDDDASPPPPPKRKRKKKRKAAQKDL